MINEIKEDYCTFNESKLLREKGFDVPCRNHYIVNTKGEYGGEGNTAPSQINHIPKPTREVAREWLRLNFGVWFAIEASRLMKFNARIYKETDTRMLTQPKQFEVVNSIYDFNTPRELVGVAMNYVLTKLI